MRGRTYARLRSRDMLNPSAAPTDCMFSAVEGSVQQNIAVMQLRPEGGLRASRRIKKHRSGSSFRNDVARSLRLLVELTGFEPVISTLPV